MLDYVVLFQLFCLTEGGSSVDPKVAGIDVSLKQGTVAERAPPTQSEIQGHFKKYICKKFWYPLSYMKLYITLWEHPTNCNVASYALLYSRPSQALAGSTSLVVLPTTATSSSCQPITQQASQRWQRIKGGLSRHPSFEIAAPAKQGSSHYWQFSKAHTDPRVACGF